jgi:hypothetical protein
VSQAATTLDSLLSWREGVQPTDTSISLIPPTRINTRIPTLCLICGGGGGGGVVRRRAVGGRKQSDVGTSVRDRHLTYIHTYIQYVLCTWYMTQNVVR